MKINNYLVFLLGMLLSASPYAATANMEGVPSYCRVFANGDLQISLVSNKVTGTCFTSPAEVRLYQNSAYISPTTTNRYLAMCLNAKVTAQHLRMDNLTCSNGMGTASPTTAFMVKNP